MLCFTTTSVSLKGNSYEIILRIHSSQATGFKKINDDYKVKIKSMLKQEEDELDKKKSKKTQKAIDLMKIEKLILIMLYEAPKLSSPLIIRKNKVKFRDVLNTIKNAKISQ